MITLELINHGNQIEEILDIEAIVSNPIERLQYSEFIDDRSVAISYIGSEEVNSRDNIHIHDLSWKVLKNNPNFFKIEEFELSFTERSFYSEFKEIEITNKYFVNKESKKEPLFFKHKRKFKEASLHFQTLGDEFDVEEGILIQSGELFTNYQNFFDKETGSFRIYYINGIDLDGVAFNELLDLVPVFKEAGWEDIDLDTGELAENTYTKEISGNGFFYQINKEDVCGTDDSVFSVKIKEENLIKLLKPESFSLQNSWIPRIQNGLIIDSGRKYWMPEFSQQPFNPIFGLIKLNNKNCFFVSPTIIKVPVKQIEVDPKENIEATVFIYDELESLVKLVTTDVSLIGTRYSDTEIVYEAGINSWDRQNGFIELDFNVDASQIIQSTFYYKTDSLVFSELSINPFENDKILYNNYYFYLKPNKVLGEKSVFYHLLDEDGVIVETSDVDFKVEEEGVFNPNTYIGKTVKEFKENYCATYDNEFHFMELGEYSLEEDFFKDEIHQFEVKEKNYISKNNFEDALNRQWQLLQSKHGYGELGQVLQKNNILYLEVPEELLDTKGGDYSKEELDRFLRNRLQADVDLIIEYTYPKSELTIDNSEVGKVTISCSWEKPGVYKLFKSENKIRPEVHYLEYSSSTEEEIIFIDENVESDKVYYYWVQIDEHSFSNLYGVKVR